MKKLLNIFAGIGLMLAGATATVSATPGVAEAQPHHARDGRHDRRDDRRWDRDRRNDRRWDRDRRGDRRWRNDRRAGNDRRWGNSRYRGGERIIDPRSREARAMGVQYRGPCRYVIRNGRRVCG
ncbi:hypothetical protein ASG37_01150 [Sphingomonas sp. Leaf407]|uniref:hypothetical protein n=1 Tax=unclassified Sphingomonas TaxID=196159 RepID=UPI0006F2051F|nr:MULTISPECIES: hypothetical protein [unclassified Sphingomonas]KQN40444.1 hypothetical protein ASE97_01180 [Sphingomonas sp. Leaf42]KQT29799.1 hypothetical protein ASG37_01150 [Sphingomonas sp. Leaf407]